MALAVRNRLVKMQAIAMFASVRDVGRYTDDELRRLSLLRVGGLTIGMESADDRALEIGGKGYTSADVREQCLRLEAAGMEYSLIYMTGLAGAGRGVDAAKNSLEVINLLRPRFIGVGSLTPFEGTRLHESAREEEFEPPPEMERIEELVELIRGSGFARSWTQDPRRTRPPSPGCSPTTAGACSPKSSTPSRARARRRCGPSRGASPASRPLSHGPGPSRLIPTAPARQHTRAPLRQTRRGARASGRGLTGKATGTAVGIDRFAVPAAQSYRRAERRPG